MFERAIAQTIQRITRETLRERPVITLEEILAAEHIPERLKRFFATEVDWWLYNESLARESSRRFDFSNPELAALVTYLEQVQFRHARFEREEFLAVLDSAVKLTYNYVCRPQTTLKWYIFRGQPVKPLREVMLRFSAFTDYDYFITVFSEWVERKRAERPSFDAISAAEFERVVRRTDDQILLSCTVQDLLEMMNPLFEFLGEGENLEVPIDALVIFFDDKNIRKLVDQLETYRDRRAERIGRDAFVGLLDELLNTAEEEPDADFSAVYQNDELDEVVRHHLETLAHPADAVAGVTAPDHTIPPQSGAPWPDEPQMPPMTAAYPETQAPDSTAPQTLAPQPPVAEHPTPVAPSHNHYDTSGAPGVAPPLEPGAPHSDYAEEQEMEDSELDLDAADDEMEPVEPVSFDIEEEVDAEDDDEEPVDLEGDDLLDEELDLEHLMDGESVEEEEIPEVDLELDLEEEATYTAPSAAALGDLSGDDDESDGTAEEQVEEIRPVVENRPVDDVRPVEERGPVEEERIGDEQIGDEQRDEAAPTASDDAPEEPSDEGESDADDGGEVVLVRSGLLGHSYEEEQMPAPASVSAMPAGMRDVRSFIDVTLERKVVRKIFDRDRAAYDAALDRINGAANWKEACQVLDDIFIQRSIDPYMRTAMRFTDAVYGRYIPSRA